MNKLEEIEQYKKDRPNYWIAHVSSPEMGILYSHDFESNSVNKILEQIIEGLDLTEADFINIKFERRNP